MRLLLAVLCLIGLACANPVGPNFRYAYTIPLPGQAQPWSQFDVRADDKYEWGYEFKDRAHYESKDAFGVVKGTHGYMDAYGNPIVVKYISHPNTGYQVDTGATANEDSAPDTYNFKEERLGLERADLVENAISPLLKNAVSERFLIPIGSSDVGIPTYAVNPDIAQDVGISELAKRFDAIPVAAVHDVQRRPIFGVSRTAFAPVLVHNDDPDRPFTLEVSIQ